MKSEAIRPRLASRSSTFIVACKSRHPTGRTRCSPPGRTTRNAAKTCELGSTCFPKFPSNGRRSWRVWQKMNAEVRQELDGEAVPDANEEVLIYQTLVGTWPLERLVDAESREAYVRADCAISGQGAARSQAAHQLDEPLRRVRPGRAAASSRTILAEVDLPFVHDMDEFVRSIADAGFTNSLAQTVVKICAPGVPDFYHGVEFWDFNLVDPDNRRPVDFDARRAALATIRQQCQRGTADATAALVAAWPMNASSCSRSGAACNCAANDRNLRVEPTNRWNVKDHERQI